MHTMMSDFHLLNFLPNDLKEIKVKEWSNTKHVARVIIQRYLQKLKSNLFVEETGTVNFFYTHILLKFLHTKVCCF